MKKLIVLLALTALILSVGVSAECTDSDDGRNYGVKGTTTVTKNEKIISENIDLCMDKLTVIEYLCDQFSKTTFEYYPCDCVDGVCINLVEETPEEEEIVEEEVVEEEEEVVEEEEPVEVPPEETPPETPEITPAKIDYTKTGLLVTLLVIIIVAGIMFWKVKKKKGSKEEEVKEEETEKKSKKKK